MTSAKPSYYSTLSRTPLNTMRHVSSAEYRLYKLQKLLVKDLFPMLPQDVEDSIQR